MANFYDEAIKKYKIAEPTIVGVGEMNGKKYENYGYKTKDGRYYRHTHLLSMGEEDKEMKKRDVQIDAIMNLVWAAKDSSGIPLDHDHIIGIELTKEKLKELRKFINSNFKPYGKRKKHPKEGEEKT